MFSIQRREIHFPSLFLFPGILLDLGLLWIEPPRRRWQDSKLSEDPGDPIGGLGADTQPVLETILLEADLLHPVSVGNGIVRSHYFQEFAVPWSLGICRYHPVERSVCSAKALQPETNDHGCWR